MYKNISKSEIIVFENCLLFKQYICKLFEVHSSNPNQKSTWTGSKKCEEAM